MRFQATRAPLLQSKPKNLTAVRILVHAEHACWRTGAVLQNVKHISETMHPQTYIKGTRSTCYKSIIGPLLSAGFEQTRSGFCLASPAEHGTQKPQNFAKGRKSRV